jgi:hypothetical protein
MLVVLTQKPGSERALLAGFFATLAPHPSNFAEKLSHGASTHRLCHCLLLIKAIFLGFLTLECWRFTHGLA